MLSLGIIYSMRDLISDMLITQLLCVRRNIAIYASYNVNDVSAPFFHHFATAVLLTPKPSLDRNSCKNLLVVYPVPATSIQSSFIGGFSIFFDIVIRQELTFWTTLCGSTSRIWLAAVLFSSICRIVCCRRVEIFSICHICGKHACISVKEVKP